MRTTANPAISEPVEEFREVLNWKAVASMGVVHSLSLLVFVVPFSWKLVGLALGMYAFRMLFVVIGYHRYFSHRSFQTSRAFQFVLAFLAVSSAQKGVLWWAAHHRHHHQHSDEEIDAHSPGQKGLFWSHIGWTMCRKYDETRWELIKDFSRYPELVFLNTNWLLPAGIGVAVLFLCGGFPAVVYGGFVSTALLFQGTFTVNSLAHVFGKRRYLTGDTSRNNLWLALISHGDGWHNNHHYHQNTARYGWFWWEIDIAYYVLRVFEFFGLVWKLRMPEPQTRDAHLKYTVEQRESLKLPPVLQAGTRPKPMTSTV